MKNSLRPAFLQKRRPYCWGSGTFLSGASVVISVGVAVRKRRLLRPPDLDATLIVTSGHSDQPGIAADLAVLHEASRGVRLHVDLDAFTAIGTGHLKPVWHT
jgi:hypothetical protein